MKLDLNIGIYCRREGSIHLHFYELGLAELSFLLPSYLHLQGAYFANHKKTKYNSCLRWSPVKICDIFLEYEIWVCLYDTEVRKFSILGSKLSLLFALYIVSSTDTKSVELHQVLVPPALAATMWGEQHCTGPIFSVETQHCCSDWGRERGP